MTGILAEMALASLAVAGVGVWWLIFFNRGGVKAQWRQASVCFVAGSAHTHWRSASSTLGLINFALIAGGPGRRIRLFTMYQPTGTPGLPPQFMESMVGWIVAVGLCANVAFVALLGIARGAYRRACTTPQ